jgi:TolB-like protein
MKLGVRLALAGVCLLSSALITWAVYDSSSVESGQALPTERQSVESAAPGARSTLWVLAVGVSTYADPRLNLRFADADARSIAEAIRSAAARGQYREVRSLVLTNEQVTRASLLDSLSRFLGEAGPDDVAALFIAGHGVRDLASGSYYFLPSPANPENLLTEGLRMTDFDAMLRQIRRNVRAVIVMLDTCHAGAFQLSGDQVVAADEMAAQVSAGEGFFLLAASRPGEESKEQEQLGHGAFTFSLLEALDGAADSDGDTVLAVSELFGYVARRVPALTHGLQHPYHKTEGTDLLLLAVAGDAQPPAAANGATPAVAAVAAAPSPSPSESASQNSIAVLEFDNLRGDSDTEWMSRALRVAFDTELSKVKALRVFSPEVIDRTSRARGADSLYTARELGVARLVAGSYHVTGHTLRIDARIVNAQTGVNEATDSVEGNLDEFFDLQKRLVLSMLRRLRVQISPSEGESIEQRTNTDMDAYRLLLESEGVFHDSQQPGPTKTGEDPGPQSRTGSLFDIEDLLFNRADAAELPQPTAAPALAAPPAADPAQAARQLLESYRSALEQKNVERVAELYAEFSDRQRDALAAYLRSADQLTVEIVGVHIVDNDGAVVVSFTRRDSFTDRTSERPVHLEARLSKTLVHEGGTWKIGATP